MNTPDALPVATPTAARITFLEDKLAFVYQYFASRAPGVTVKEEGTVAAMWSELDFLYLVDADEVTA